MAFSVDGANYTSRKKLTYNADAFISGDLTDQTVVVHMDNGESDFWDNTPGTNGDGVRFASEDGLTLYKFQVESYDATGDDAWWHVKIPTLSGSVDTDIYIYYEVDSETDGEDKENTWDSSYSAVYHNNTDQAEGAFDDATSNNINLTNDGSTDAAAQIDRGRTFVTNDSMDSASNIGISGDATFALETSFNSNTVASGANAALAIGDVASALAAASIFINFPSGGDITCAYGGGNNISTAASLFTANTDHHIVITKRAGAADTTTTIYLDGVSKSVSGSSSTPNITDGIVEIGSFNSASFFDGELDEITISNVERTADWVIARYQSSLGTWLTIGARDTGVAAGIEILRRRIEE